MNRRQFLEGSLAALAAPTLAAGPAGAVGRAAPAEPTPIGPATAFPGLHGDTWTTTWADDGTVFAVADDCFGLKAHPINSNLALFRLRGSPPDQLQVETVNPMEAFGKLTSLLEDGASWKASGLACVDGVLYLAVSRHLYMDEPYAWVQQSWDATLIKSADYGKTWSPLPSLGKSMFPGRTFSNPYFVQFGQDRKGAPDAGGEYVYATSNDGCWNNGSTMTLGRVARSQLGNLDPSEWEFVHRFDKTGQPVWGRRHDNAIATFRNPGRTGMTGIQYIADLNAYILPQWYYPDLANAIPAERWKRSRFKFYRANHPWGPWTRFLAQEFYPQGYYNPGIPAKFIAPGGTQAWVFASGNFFPSAAGNPYYTINMMPVALGPAA